VHKLDEDLDALLDETLKQTKDEIRKILPDLQDEARAVEVGKILKEALAEKMAVEVDVDLDKFLDIMNTIDKKLNKLLTKKDLSPEEQFEKELITTWAIFISEAMRESLAAPVGAHEVAPAPVKKKP